MSDFTKEELQVILDSIEFDMHTYKPSDNGFNHNLVAKLRLMIDYTHTKRQEEPMIEVEINHIEPSTHNREIKIWINGNLVYANAIATPVELREWRDALYQEKIWIDRYLRAQGLEGELI